MRVQSWSMVLLLALAGSAAALVAWQRFGAAPPLPEGIMRTNGRIEAEQFGWRRSCPAGA